MRWAVKTPQEWERRFALLPFKCVPCQHWVWMEWRWHNRHDYCHCNFDPRREKRPRQAHDNHCARCHTLYLLQRKVKEEPDTSPPSAYPFVSQLQQLQKAWGQMSSGSAGSVGSAWGFDPTINVNQDTSTGSAP